MLLRKLLERCDIEDVSGDLDIQVEKNQNKSREVEEGDVFSLSCRRQVGRT